MKKDASTFAKQFDFLGVSVPKLNIEGERHVRTYLGSCSSIIIAILIASFALIKLEHLASRSNPSPTKNLEVTKAEATYDTSSEDFMMAFTLDHWQKGPRNDPRYTQWVMEVSTSFSYNGGVAFYPMHKCTDEEFQKFYAFEGGAASKAEKFHADGHLWCMETAQLIDLKGSWKTDEYFGAVEAVVFTCASEITLYDGSIQGG